MWGNGDGDELVRVLESQGVLTSRHVDGEESIDVVCDVVCDIMEKLGDAIR